MGIRHLSWLSCLTNTSKTKIQTIKPSKTSTAMKKTIAESPAFPKSAFYHPDGGLDKPEDGMDMRQYYAGVAMQGLLTRVPHRHGGETDLGIMECRRIAGEAVIMADELIKALNEQK